MMRSPSEKLPDGYKAELRRRMEQAVTSKPNQTVKVWAQDVLSLLDELEEGS